MEGLHTIDPRLDVKPNNIEQDAGKFRDIFRRPINAPAGAYWLYLSTGRIVYIGKCETNVWARIQHHARTAMWKGDPATDHHGTIGLGWEFPNSKHLDSTTICEETKLAIRQGEFHVGWFGVDPSYCATLLEVYLQTLFHATSAGLPELCKRIA